jgi:hypothetical protein
LGDQKLSRLELYVEVLKALRETQSLNLKAIQSTIKVDRTSLSAAMKFLENQNLVVPQNVSNRVAFKNTARGIRVFKYLAEGTRASDQVTPGMRLMRL